MDAMEIQKLNNHNEVDISSIATSSEDTQDFLFDALSKISNITSASKFSSPNLNDFNDRSPNARDARLANSILSLDEDIPQDVDYGIKRLLKSHITTAMELEDHYLEFKQHMAIINSTDKNLPRSKARSARQSSPSPKNDAL